MVLLIPVIVGVFLLEGKSVFLLQENDTSRGKRLRTVYFCIWVVGIALLAIGVLDAKTAVIDAILECVRKVKLWITDI